MSIDGGDLGGMVATVAVMAIPILAILTAHQRKMAMIIHGSQQNQLQNNAQQDQLSSEVRDLKQIVYQQSIAIDSISTKLDRISSNTGVQERLSGTQS